MRQHFRERAAMRGFGHVPPGHRHAHRRAEIRRAGADAAQRADDQGGRASGADGVQFALQLVQQMGRGRIDADRSADRAVLLGGPAFQRDRRPGIAGPIAKGGDTATVSSTRYSRS